MQLYNKYVIVEIDRSSAFNTIEEVHGPYDNEQEASSEATRMNAKSDLTTSFNVRPLTPKR